jgi:hypothetical protein
MVDKDEKKAEKTAQVVQEIVDKETEQGFRGVKIDPTDSNAYTVAGVISGAPTPETDHEQALKASSSGLTKFNNKGQA